MHGKGKVVKNVVKNVALSAGQYALLVWRIRCIQLYYRSAAVHAWELRGVGSLPTMCTLLLHLNSTPPAALEQQQLLAGYRAANAHVPSCMWLCVEAISASQSATKLPAQALNCIELLVPTAAACSGMVVSNSGIA